MHSLTLDFYAQRNQVFERLINVSCLEEIRLAFELIVDTLACESVKTSNLFVSLLVRRYMNVDNVEYEKREQTISN